MRIFLTGSNYFSLLTRIQNALLKKKHEVETLEFKIPRGGWRNFIDFSFPAQIQLLNFPFLWKGELPQFYRDYNMEVRERLGVTQPDILLVIRGEFLKNETVKYARDLKVKIFLWMYDSIYLYSEVEKYLNSVDQFFAYEPRDVYYVKSKYKIPSNYLMLGYDPDEYFPIDPHQYECDLLFVGALYPNRIKILNSVCRSFAQQYRVQIHADYVTKDRFWRWIDLKIRYPFLLKCLKPGIHSHREINKMFNYSKININIHNATKSVEQGTNYRFFELLGSGSFQLVEKKWLAKAGIEDGDGIISYQSENDLLEKIDYYLKHDSQRKAVIERGRKISQLHKIENRIDSILAQFSKDFM